MSDLAKYAEIGLCLLLAGADGKITEAEIGALSTRMGTLLGDEFPTAGLASMVEDELRAIDELGADDYVDRLLTRLPPEARLSALRSACLVAFADGTSDEEEEGVSLLASALGIDQRHVPELIAGARRRG